MTSPIQHSAPTRHRLGEAPDRRLHMDLHHGRRLHLESAFCGLPKAPWSPYCHLPTTPPCWEGLSFGKPTHGHPLWNDCTARSLRLPRPTWRPPTTQNHRPVQLPPPPSRTDSASTTDQSQQMTAPDLEHEGQGTQRPGRARASGWAHKPAPAVPRQRRTSQPAQGRSGGASQSEQQRAPDWNPLAKLSTHRSGGWKKDLDCYMGAYFRLNYRQEPASKWPELKAKFFKFLIDHHSEWKSIRNNDPLGYLPYMEAQFERVTGYKLVGLGSCTEWIHAGTYYHWAIAQQGQLGRCPRLAGIPPPQGPMTPPPYPPVTAAASTQATVPDPPWGGGG